MKPPIITPRYTHPLSEETFATAALAKADHKRVAAAQAKETARRANQNALNNYLRLNATSIPHIKEMMIEMVREHCDAELTFTRFDLTFGMVDTTHSAPLGQRTTGWGQNGKDPHVPQLGWHGHVDGSLKSKKALKWYFSDLCGDGTFENPPIRFIGLHAGSGGGGNDDFGYGFSLFLDDFPLLKAQYAKAKTLTAERIARQEAIAAHDAKAYQIVCARPDGADLVQKSQWNRQEAKDLQAKASQYEMEARALDLKLVTLHKAESAATLPAWAPAVPVAEHAALDALFGGFRG